MKRHPVVWPDLLSSRNPFCPVLEKNLNWLHLGDDVFSLRFMLFKVANSIKVGLKKWYI
jgi:hypothetical protein